MKQSQFYKLEGPFNDGTCFTKTSLFFGVDEESNVEFKLVMHDYGDGYSDWIVYEDKGQVVDNKVIVGGANGELSCSGQPVVKMQKDVLIDLSAGDVASVSFFERGNKTTKVLKKLY